MDHPTGKAFDLFDHLLGFGVQWHQQTRLQPAIENSRAKKLTTIGSIVT